MALFKLVEEAKDVDKTLVKCTNLWLGLWKSTMQSHIICNMY